MPCSGVDLEFYAVFLRGYSSVGRAMALQAIGRGFEPHYLHQPHGIAVVGIP